MIKEKVIRTGKQSKSLHLYFQQLAEALNNAGLDARMVLRPEIEIPWSPQMIKDLLWRPVQESYTGEKSTTSISTKELSEVHQIIERHLNEKFGAIADFPPFPSNEEISFKSLTK
jgi:hypothetical protein